jgi:hypothetical protein
MNYATWKARDKRAVAKELSRDYLPDTMSNKDDFYKSWLIK